MTNPPLSLAALEADLARYANAPVLVIGDVMLDSYLIGDAKRISPEAPIPVVLVEQTRHMVGGAGNVAKNIRSLGGRVCLLGVCGADQSGDIVRALLAADGIDAALSTPPQRRTTSKTRVLARQQQMLRIDQEESRPLTDDQTDLLLRAIRERLPHYKALVISDYGKGLITQHFMDGIRSIHARYPDIPVLVDPKLPNFELYSGVTMLTPNTKETSEGAKMPIDGLSDLLAAGRAFFDRLGCERLLTTLGPQGMALFLSPDEVLHIPTVARKVYDVTGAGDTVIATVALGLAAGLGLLEACVLANYAAGIVVAEVGAACASPEQMREALQNLPLPSIGKLHG